MINRLIIEIYGYCIFQNAYGISNHCVDIMCHSGGHDITMSTVIHVYQYYQGNYILALMYNKLITMTHEKNCY